MSGFSNPVANAAGTLIRTVMKSVNYVLNTTGWAIYKNGNADFAAGAFRGTVTVTGPNGAQIVIDAGATYPNINWYSPDHTNFAGMSITGGTSGADPLLTSGTSTPLDGIVRRHRLWMNGALDQISLQVIKQSNQAGLGGALILTSDGLFIGYRDSDAAIFHYLQWTVAGPVFMSSGSRFDLAAGQLKLNNATLTGHNDTWHAATLQNGWTNQAAPAPAAQYRLSMVGETVQLTGEIASGTIVNGTVVFNLPAGYRPLTTRMTFPVAVNPSPAAGSVGPLFQILTNGNVTVWGATAASSVYFNITFPLDNV